MIDPTCHFSVYLILRFINSLGADIGHVNDILRDNFVGLSQEGLFNLLGLHTRAFVLLINLSKKLERGYNTHSTSSKELHPSGHGHHVDLQQSIQRMCGFKGLLWVKGLI